MVTTLAPPVTGTTSPPPDSLDPAKIPVLPARPPLVQIGGRAATGTALPDLPLPAPAARTKRAKAPKARKALATATSKAIAVTVPPELIQKIRRTNEAAEKCVQDGLAYAHECGGYLVEAKKHIPHGAKESFYVEVFGISERVAQARMKLAAHPLEYWQDHGCETQKAALAFEAKKKSKANPASLSDGTKKAPAEEQTEDPGTDVKQPAINRLARADEILSVLAQQIKSAGSMTWGQAGPDAANMLINIRKHLALIAETLGIAMSAAAHA